MLTPLSTSLWITLIGMGLVFVAILLLWALMELLMRFSARFQRKEEEIFPSEDAIKAALDPTPVHDLAGERKRRAAAAAVAVALALQSSEPASTLSSAWQSLNRARQLNHPTRFNQKS